MSVLSDLAQELADAMADEWPDTAIGWSSYSDRYQLVDEVIAVLTSSAHVRRHLVAFLRRSNWEPAGCFRCGHPESHHDAGECWTLPDGRETHGETSCKCSLFDPVYREVVDDDR